MPESQTQEAAQSTDLSLGPVQWLDIAELHESPLNPRQFYPEGPLEELAQSMRAHGFQAWKAIVVRRNASGYEIGAGHRRFRAAQRAGLTQVPVIVADFDDAGFLDILNFDNSGREDVHPLHEAAGWRQWMKSTGQGVADIAARIGQSKEYVYGRLKYASLIPEAQQQFLEGKYGARVAERIARRTPEIQEKALKFLAPPQWAPEKKPSVRELEEWLSREADVDLSQAPFDREDETLLRGAGSCVTCPKRAANDPGWTPPEDEEDRFPDTCLDSRCYAQKVRNHVERAAVELQAKLPAPQGLAAQPVLRVATGYADKAGKGVYKSHEFEKVAKGDKDAKPAVVAAGKDAGKTIYVKLKPAPKKQDWNADNEARRKAREREEKLAQAERAIRMAVAREILGKVREFGLDDLRAMLADLIEEARGLESICELFEIKVTNYASGAAIVKALPSFQEDALARLAVALGFSGALAEYRCINKKTAEPLLDAAKRFKVDAAKIRQQLEAAKEAKGGVNEAIAKLPVLGSPEAAKKKTAKKAASAVKVPAPTKKAKAAKPAKKAAKK